MPTPLASEGAGLIIDDTLNYAVIEKHLKKMLNLLLVDSADCIMVFPRNAGFGRCYFVSTRHGILSNIDRNLIGGFHAISGDTNNNGEMNKCWWTNKAS